MTASSAIPNLGQRKASESISTVACSAVDSIVTRVLDSSLTRVGATIFNEHIGVMYLKLGDTSSMTSYTVQVPSLTLFQVPLNYVGKITAVTMLSKGLQGPLMVTEYI